MSHLTDEQFEALLQGQDLHQDHLGRCEQCRARLAEKQALAERLRSAFSQVSPSLALSQRIREQVSHQTKPAGQTPSIRIKQRLRVWTAGLSAAAVLIVACILAFSLTPSTAQATPSILAEIHTQNMAGQHEFWAETDPNVLAARYTERLGFAAQLPCPCQGLKLCSCCIEPCLGAFRDHLALKLCQRGHYVEEKPAARCGGINAVCERSKSNPIFLEPIHQVNQVL